MAIAEYTYAKSTYTSMGICRSCGQCKPLRLHPDLGRHVLLCKPCRKALDD